MDPSFLSSVHFLLFLCCPHLSPLLPTSSLFISPPSSLLPLSLSLLPYPPSPPLPSPLSPPPPLPLSPLPSPPLPLSPLPPSSYSLFLYQLVTTVIMNTDNTKDRAMFIPAVDRAFQALSNSSECHRTLVIFSDGEEFYSDLINSRNMDKEVEHVLHGLML